MVTDNQRLFNKDFTLVVIGQIISLFGNAILRFALPLYLLRMSNSAFIFGIVSALSFIPVAVLAVIGGILADRLNKRNIMVLLDFITAVLILVFSVIYKDVSIVPLLIIVLMSLFGISGLYQPTVQASIPLLVNEKKILSANAVISQVGTLANLIGPLMGGILFNYFGITPILLISIVCFFLSAFMEIFIKIPFEKQSSDRSVLITAKNDLKDSYNFAKHEKPVFINIALITALFNMVLTTVIIVGTPIIIIQILKMNDFELGITQGVLGVGGLFGGIVSGLLAKKLEFKFSYIFLVIASVSTFGMGFAMLLNFSNYITYILITVASFILMSAATIFTIQVFTLIQTETPPNLLGKIMGVITAIALSSQPVGQAVYGFVFDYFIKHNFVDYAYSILIVSSIFAFAVSLYAKKVFVGLDRTSKFEKI